jgi:hypothetical protein
MPLTRESAATVLRRRTKTIPSPIFGDDVTIQELARAEWREAEEWAATGEKTAEGVPIILVDRWNVARFAAGAIGSDGALLFSRDEVLAWPNRDDLWAEIARIASEIDALSEVGPSFRTGSDTSADQG